MFNLENKIIIHIDGVQGSGKSYICSKLKNILCIDTDNIMKKARKIGNNTNNINKLKKIEQMLINKYIEKNDKIAFVGMTIDIPLSTHKYFIKITDFTLVFKRLLLRELDKIYENYNKIKKHIKEENNPKEINIERIAELSVIFPPNYKAFLEDYKDRLNEAKKNKYIPKTQDEIIKIVNKLND